MKISPNAKQFLEMRSVADLAALLSSSEKRLHHFLFAESIQYRRFEISKKSGSTREIEAPGETLRIFQRVIARLLQDIFVPRTVAHGFVRSRSILSNASVHAGRALVLNIDLKDFFHSIHFGRVRGIFSSRPYRFPIPLATTLAQLCCYRRRLPQGAPTSPVLSNLACRGLDQQLTDLARMTGSRYSRYADDITFSTNERTFAVEIVANPFSTPPTLGSVLQSVVQTNGFSVNEAKTRLRTSKQRQLVTGLVVNHRPNVRPAFSKALRAALHCWKRHGEDEAQKRFQEQFDWRVRSGESPSLRRHLKGQLSFLRMIRASSSSAYARPALQFSQLTNSHPVFLEGEAAKNRALLESAIWRLESPEDAEGKFYAGTAFALEHYGLVTCAHVVTAGGGGLTWTASRGAGTSSTIISNIKAHAHVDLARANSGLFLHARLRRAKVRPSPTNQVLVCGYPQNRRPTDEPIYMWGTVIGERTVSAVVHFELDIVLYPGLSGSPVLDNQGHVIGVVRYDSTGVTPNSIVSIDHIDELARQDG